MKKLIAIFVLLALFSAAALGLLITTESGFRWLVHTGAGLAGENVRVGGVSGSLLSKWKLEKLAIKTQAADVTIFECSGDWQPAKLLDRTLRVAGFYAQGVDVRLKEHENGSITKEKKRQIDFSGMTLPFSIFLESVKVNNLKLWAPDGAELTTIDTLTFGLETVSSQVTLSDFVLSSTDYGLELQASLDLQEQGELQLAGSISALIDDIGPVNGSIHIDGPLSLLSIQANVFPPVPVKLVGTLKDIFTTPSWQAEISTTGLNLSDVVNGADTIIISGKGNIFGNLKSYSGSLAGGADVPGLGEVVLKTEYTGDLNGVTLNQVEGVVPFGHVSSEKTSISWADGISWDGKILFSDFDPGVFDPIYSGKLSATVTSTGRYAVSEPLQGNLLVDDLKGQIYGKEIKGKGRTDIRNNGIDISGLELVSGSSVLSIEGNARMDHGLLNWQKPLAWKLAVRMQDFDPSILHSDYPGRLNAHLTTSGILDGESVSADADIFELNGTLRDYPLAGSGKLKVRDKSVQLREILLKSGSSELMVQGQINGQLDLSVSLISKDLGEVVAGGKGNLELQGTVSGTREHPQVDLVFDVADVSYNDLAVEELHGHFSGGSISQAEIVGSLTGSGIDFKAMTLDTVNFAIEGSADDHLLTLDIKSEQSTVSGNARGAVEDQQVWKGELKDLAINNPLLGNWNQVSPVGLEVSQAGLLARELCLAAGKENICLSAAWSATEDLWNGELAWQNLDLGRLTDQAGGSLKISGRTEGALSLEGNAERISFGGGQLKIFDAALGEGAARDDWEIFDVKEVSLDVVLETETLKSDLLLMMKDGNHLVGNIVVPGVGGFQQDYSSLPLTGELDIAAVNLDFVAPLTSYYVYPTGDLKGELKLSGTLLDPVATGYLSLFNGNIEFPTFGVSLYDAIFRVAGRGTELQIWGEGTSGPGRLYANGSLNFGKSGVAGEFNFVGQNIDTFDLPEYEIRTSPDLRLVFDSDGGSLVGQLYVPHAMITPEEMTGSLSVSDDVVFLDEEEVKPAGGWNFTTILDVELGDDVQLDGYGLSGYLRGSLMVNKVPGLFVTGQGVLSLEDGQFSIYGRSLDIRRGRVLFRGGAIDDPGIDVRAQRVVADKNAGPNGIKVGVDVSGTAEDLEFKLFSDPYMVESDILAYMVVGRSMSDTGSAEQNILSSAAMALGVEGGTGLIQDLTKILPVDDVYFEGETSGEDERLSLVVGKKLTDELFIGYDHNFFDQVGEMTIRYDLGKGFYIESRTSAEATGTDLLFSFER